MLSFEFTINRSFLDYSAHPITVPRTQGSNSHLESEFRSGESIDIRLPDGGSADGILYGGCSSWGPY